MPSALRVVRLKPGRKVRSPDSLNQSLQPVTRNTASDRQSFQLIPSGYESTRTRPFSVLKWYQGKFEELCCPELILQRLTPYMDKSIFNTACCVVLIYMCFLTTPVHFSKY